MSRDTAYQSVARLVAAFVGLLDARSAISFLKRVEDDARIRGASLRRMLEEPTQ